MTAVLVNTPYQVCHEGTVYRPGESVDIPEALAQLLDRQRLGDGGTSQASRRQCASAKRLVMPADPMAGSTPDHPPAHPPRQ